MKIALIGSTSFVGRNILKEIDAQALDYSLWNRTPNEGEFFFHYPHHKIDVNDLADYPYIIYTAGAGVQAKGDANSENLYGLNTGYPIEMISRLRDLNYRGSLITFGSYFEIGKTDTPSALTEEDVIFSKNAAFNEYVISKRIFTQFIHYQLHLNLPFSLSHFILPNVYGVGENENRILPYVVSCVKSQQEIAIGNGTQVRQFLNVSDISGFIVNLIMNNRVKFGIYNLGSKAIMSVGHLIKTVEQVAKDLNYKMPKVNCGSVIRADASANYLAVDDRLSRKRLNWNDNISVQEGIHQYF